MPCGGQRLSVVRTGRAVGEKPKILCAAQRRLRHETPGLPGVETLDRGDFIGARHNEVGDLVEHRLALITGRPRPAREAFLGRCDRRIQFGLGRVANLAQRLAGRGVGYRKQASRTIDRAPGNVMTKRAIPKAGG
ncbi:MAG: hypothetical protein BWY40_01248 [bacterium ADurb.Bin270]|nr:MAG: hypothetical protein BWY40_01248 [bacterium ADurb.Bin270]